MVLKRKSSFSLKLIFLRVELSIQVAPGFSCCFFTVFNGIEILNKLSIILLSIIRV